MIQFRIDIHTGDNPNTFDDTLCIPAVLSPDQLNCMRKILVSYRVIEHHKSFWALHNLILNVLPGQFRAKFFSSQMAIEGIMTILFTVFGKIRQRIIDLADQQVFAIVQAADNLGSRSHTLKLIRFAPLSQSLSFA